jgi:hypothetical protein
MPKTAPTLTAAQLGLLAHLYPSSIVSTSTPGGTAASRLHLAAVVVPDGVERLLERVNGLCPCALALIAVADHGEEPVWILPEQFHGSTAYRELATADHAGRALGQAHVVQVAGHSVSPLFMSVGSLLACPLGDAKIVGALGRHQGDADRHHIGGSLPDLLRGLPCP